MGSAISPGESPAVATWYKSGWNVWKFLRSITVICSGALAKERAALRPPNPAPIMTTRGLSLIITVLTLLLGAYLYKIHAMADGSRSSAQAGTKENALLRWLMPSVADIIFVALLASLLLTPLSVKLLGDAGTGWHIRTGQLILATHAIPRVDPFSSQVSKPWIAWEWLYDVIVGWLDSHAGLNGVVWFTAVVIASVLGGLFRLLVRRGSGFLMALVLTLLAMAASMIHFLARPHVLSWLFTLAWFWIISCYEGRNERANRRIWLLPLMMLAWVNVHGGFLLGFVLLAAFWLGSLWTWLSLKQPRIEESLQKIAAGKRVRELTLVGVLSLAVSFVNPYGWHLHEHIYRYLTNHFLMDHIDEFQSPNFHGIAQRCFLALLLVAIAVLVANGQKLRASEIVLLLFAVYAGLYASRNIPVSSILLAAIVGPLIPLWGDRAFFHKMTRMESALGGHLWPILATLGTLVIAANAGRVGSTVFMDAHFDPQRMPVDAVNFVAAAGVKDPLLSPDYWGGYLIYRTYPHNRVVIDDRHDFYGEPWLLSYLRTTHVEPDWEDFVKGQSCLVLPTKAALTEVLRKTGEWNAVYSDDVATVFMPSRISPGSDKPPGY